MTTRNRVDKAAAGEGKRALTGRQRAVKMPLATLVLLVVIAATTSVAWAAGDTPLCFQEKEGGAIKQTKDGVCPKGYRLTEVGSSPFNAEEETTLKSVLPHIKYLASGVGGKPTIQFSGVNVQVVNGEGVTASTNGEGNIVIGYDENPTNRAQTGSHNLIVGPWQQYTSYAGIVSGSYNAIEAEGAAAIGGYNNDADGGRAVVTGGEGNVAYGFASAVSGGSYSSAAGKWSSISGGEAGQSSGEASSITGGKQNYAVGKYSTVGGGEENWAEDSESSVDGGYKNKAAAEFSGIFGSKDLKTSNLYEAKL